MKTDLVSVKLNDVAAMQSVVKTLTVLVNAIRIAQIKKEISLKMSAILHNRYG